MPRSKAAAPPKRQRRTPEEAKRLILEAAQRLLAARGPSAIALKEVAREAGVSHALVSHYFGTVDALVEAALQAHMEGTRHEMLGRIADVMHAGPREWIDMAFDQLAHPISGRTLAWAILGDHLESEDFFPRRDQGMRMVRDAIEARIRAQLGEDAAPSTEDIEFAILLVFCTGLGYSVARSVVWGSLSREPTPERDRWFREKLADLVTESVEAGRALAPPGEPEEGKKNETTRKTRPKGR